MTQAQHRPALPQQAMRVLVAAPDRRAAEMIPGLGGHAAIDVAFDPPSTLDKASSGAYDVVVLYDDARLPPQWRLSPDRVRAVTEARILLMSEAYQGAPPPSATPLEQRNQLTAGPDLAVFDRPDGTNGTGTQVETHRLETVPGGPPALHRAAVAGPAGVSTAPIRVLLAEGSALYAGALSSLLSVERDIAVVATVLTDSELAATAIRSRAQVALLDIDAPGRDGLAICTLLADRVPDCRAIALSGVNLPEAVHRRLRKKVHGLVNKHSEPTILLDSIRRVARGEEVLDPKCEPGGARDSVRPLTVRELQLLREAANGHSVRELAEQFSLSPGTVRNYLSRVMAKMGARNRIEAIRIAREHGWL